jgi:hypothetical protein
LIEKYAPMIWIVIGVSTAVIVVALLWGDLSFKKQTRADADRLLDAAQSSPGGTYMPEDLSVLPEPVQKYFQFALTPGQDRIDTAYLEQKGHMRQRPKADWTPLRSFEYMTARPPGFVWRARVKPLAFMWLLVRDTLVRGHAGMTVKSFGLMKVAETHGPELDRAALVRWLAETPWIPTALLPGRGLVWEPVDHRSARATIEAHGYQVSAVFEFGEDGRIERITSRDRGRMEEGRLVPRTFVGILDDYRRHSGMMIPHRAEAQWILDDNEIFTYARLEILTAEFGFK